MTSRLQARFLLKTVALTSILALGAGGAYAAEPGNGIDTATGVSDLPLSVGGHQIVDVVKTALAGAIAGSQGVVIGGSGSLVNNTWSPPVPNATLDVNGAVRVGSDTSTCSSANLGAIRFNGTDFQGCMAAGWTSLTAAGTKPTLTVQEFYAQKIAQTNSVMGAAIQTFVARGCVDDNTGQNLAGTANCTFSYVSRYGASVDGEVWGVQRQGPFGGGQPQRPTYGPISTDEPMNVQIICNFVWNGSISLTPGSGAFTGYYSPSNNYIFKVFYNPDLNTWIAELDHPSPNHWLGNDIMCANLQ